MALLFAAAVDELEVLILVEGTMHICHPSTSKFRLDFGPLGQVGQYIGMFRENLFYDWVKLVVYSEFRVQEHVRCSGTEPKV